QPGVMGRRERERTTVGMSSWKSVATCQQLDARLVDLAVLTGFARDGQANTAELGDVVVAVLATHEQHFARDAPRVLAQDFAHRLEQCCLAISPSTPEE